MIIGGGVIIALLIAGGAIAAWFRGSRPLAAPTSPTTAEAVAATAASASSSLAPAPLRPSAPLDEVQAFAHLQRLKDFLRGKGVAKETREQLLHPLLPYLFTDNDPPPAP
jgi:hypothetical protein